MGDLSPTTAKPPKKAGFCAVVGQVVTVAIAVVVSMMLPPIIGPIVGNIASQGFAMLIGQQDKFNWKSLAITALTALVTPPATTNILVNIAQAVAVNVGVQGVAIVTGLQDKFSWTSVASAGVTAKSNGLSGRAGLGRGGSGPVMARSNLAAAQSNARKGRKRTIRRQARKSGPDRGLIRP